MSFDSTSAHAPLVQYTAARALLEMRLRCTLRRAPHEANTPAPASSGYSACGIVGGGTVGLLTGAGVDNAVDYVACAAAVAVNAVAAAGRDGGRLKLYSFSAGDVDAAKQ